MKRNLICIAITIIVMTGMTDGLTAYGIGMEPEISAKAAVLVDGESGNVLFGKNIDEQMLIASTTKIMTALVALEHTNIDDEIEIPVEATLVEGSSMYLKAGEKYTVRDILYGLMLVSGNDAAEALAIHVAGGDEAFALLMNEKAKALGMENSSFANPHGLDDPMHYSTARDMAVLMIGAMENQQFREITGAKSHTVKEQTLVNHNKLLWNYEGVNGGKTGYTMAAGRTLVSSAVRDGKQLIAVTLSDPDDWKDHASLYDWGFANFEYKRIDPGKEYIRLPVISGYADSVGVAPDQEFKVLGEKDAEVSLSFELPRFVFATVRAGDHAGRLSVMSGDAQLGSVELYYTETVELEHGVKLSALERLMRTFDADGFIATEQTLMLPLPE